jgi:small-conductance mechanosensitive channel
MSWLHAHLPLAAAAAVMLTSILIGLALQHIVRRRVRAWTQGTESKLDDALVASVHRPVPWWAAIAGVYLATRLLERSAEVGALVDKTVLGALIVSLTLWLGDLAARLMLALAESAQGNTGAAGTGVGRHVVRILVYLVGASMLLGTLGISITPLVTTLGVGGVAVALGLQNTLSNLFAGIHVTMARNLRVGDFVKLETGQEGHVEDIGWRATRIRLLQNNVVVIPNGRLADSIVTNYDLPDKELAVLIGVGVHYASDLAEVERVTGEVAREVMKEVPGGIADFEPFIRYNTFGASSIDFTVILRARQFTDNFLVKHEFIKRLAARYARDGIVIPYPIRALNLDQEGASDALQRRSEILATRNSPDFGAPAFSGRLAATVRAGRRRPRH